MKKIVFILVVSFIVLNSFGQDKKDIRDNGIQVKRSFSIDIANGDKEPSIEKEEFFNLKGDIVELKEYSGKGKTIDKWTKYKYDGQGNLIEEQELTPKGDLKERYEYKYDENGLKTEKLYYDNKNRLYKKKLFKYELRK
jgi:hypothetical protein